MSQGFSILVSEGNIAIKSFLTEEYDNCYFQNSDFCFLLEGVLINKQILFQKYAISDFKQLISELYLRKKEFFIKDFDGEFRGFLYDKKQSKVFVFTNITSTQRVFYTKTDQCILIDTSLVRLNKDLKIKKLNSKPNIENFYLLLSLGNLPENKTPIENVFKLLDGHYLNVDIHGGYFSEKKYFDVASEEIYSGSIQSAIDLLHEIFSESVKSEYLKDLEFGKPHFSLLSGGLDSRIALFYAINQNLKPDQIFCFSQSQYHDHIISEKIAKDYHISYLFQPLDSGIFLKNIDKLTEISEGTNSFLSAIHVDFAFHHLEKSSSIIHSGQIGGEILGGSYYSSPHAVAPRSSRIILRDDFLKHISSPMENILKKYDREDVFLLRNWGYNKTVVGAQAVRNSSIMISPFMNKDLLKFLFSIPHEWKYEYKFYYHWFSKFCPDVGKYVWEKSFLKPNHYWKMKFGTKYFKPIRNKFLNKFSGESGKLSMYPYEYYFQNSRFLQDYYTSYYRENIYRLEPYPQLLSDVSVLFSNPNFYSKSQAINVLSIFKLLF